MKAIRRRTFKQLSAAAFFGLCAVGAQAASINDSSFNPGTGASGPVYASALQGAPLKIIIGGAFSLVNGQPNTKIARLAEDGTVDPPALFSAHANGDVYALATITNASAQNILVGGAFSTVNGYSRVGLAKLFYNGGVDKTFNANLNGPVYAIQVSTNSGLIYIAGNFTQAGAYTRMRVARLFGDGTVDTYFDPYYGADYTVYSLSTEQGTGKVLVGGAFGNFGGYVRTRVARLLQSGAVDTTFVPSVNLPVNAVLGVSLAGDPRTLIGGEFTVVDSVTQNRIAR
jgi:Domain of unknown function (DUF5122) beta-propeller